MNTSDRSTFHFSIPIFIVAYTKTAVNVVIVIDTCLFLKSISQQNVERKFFVVFLTFFVCLTIIAVEVYFCFLFHLKIKFDHNLLQQDYKIT